MGTSDDLILVLAQINLLNTSSDISEMRISTKAK